MAASQLNLLLVDDDAELRQLLADYFGQRGYRVALAAIGEEAEKLAEQQTFDAAVVDLAMPGMSGLELLKRFEATAECPVILLTGQGTVERAVEAMKLGAYDFLAKPVSLAKLAAVVQRACDSARLRRENQQLKAAIEPYLVSAQMIGKSPPMQEVYRLIRRAGPTDKPILIQGESGTGKELVAQALHQASPRCDKPLVVINCAALPESLLESELFGHERGAFTGATETKAGLFEVADGGTLFIDEMGEMSAGLQAKLLRVLEDGSYRRVGALKERHVDVRLLTATNRDLASEVQAGRFREDLYYRIDVMRIGLPPLRERGDDIAQLAHHFAGNDWQIEAKAMGAFEQFDWPGNIRQLANAIARAKILADGRTIELKNLPFDVSQRKALETDAADHDFDAIKRRHIEDVLASQKGNKQRAARALGVSRRSLYRLLDKSAIDSQATRPSIDAVRP